MHDRALISGVLLAQKLHSKLHRYVVVAQTCRDCCGRVSVMGPKMYLLVGVVVQVTWGLLVGVTYSTKIHVGRRQQRLRISKCMGAAVDLRG